MIFGIWAPWVKGLSETVSLPLGSRVKVRGLSTPSRPHLCDLTGYVVVNILCSLDPTCVEAGKAQEHVWASLWKLEKYLKIRFLSFMAKQIFVFLGVYRDFAQRFVNPWKESLFLCLCFFLHYIFLDFGLLGCFFFLIFERWRM